MHAEYNTFFKLLGNISLYAFDRSPTAEQDDELRRPFIISSEDFLRSLYERRSVEKVIKAKLRTGSEVICLVGPPGCGKSSMGLNLKYEFDRTNTFMSFVDIRMEKILETLETGACEDLTQYLKQRVSAEYDRRLFRDDDSRDHNPRLQLFAYLLEPGSEVRKPLTLFYQIQRFENRAARFFRQWVHCDIKNREQATYYDWLVNTYTNEPQIEELVSQLEKVIQLPHLVYAARFIHGIKRQIIWLDNIDALPDDLQVEALDILKGFLITIANYAACVIAVREENVFKEENLSDEGAPPFDTRVMMEFSKMDSGQLVYPAVDIPLIKAEVLKNIFRKRMTYARNYQVNRAIGIQNNIVSAESNLSAANDINRMEQLKDTIAELQQELSDITPVISEIRFGYLLTLSTKIVQILDEERGFFIANNSIRDLLFLHRDFLRNLIASPDSEIEPPAALNYDDWYVTTMLFSWIRNVQRRYQVGMYDVIADCQMWHNTPDSIIGCLLPHLVLTCIWNLYLMHKSKLRKRFHRIFVKEIVQSLADFGYSREDVVDTLFYLSYRTGSRGNYLEIKSEGPTESLRSPADIEDDEMIRLKYRGKAMVGFVSSSFGYLYECQRSFENPHENPFAHPLVNDTNALVGGLIPYLCDLAQMHVTVFDKFKKNKALGGEKDLVSNYLLKFGVPQEKPYARKHKIGSDFNGTRRALLLECIISSLLGYTPNQGDIQMKLNTIRELFVKSLNRGKDDSAINFRKELGLPEKVSQ